MTRRLSTAIDQDAIRYAAASVAALLIDLVLTMSLRGLTDLSLTLSAAIAFITVGIAFYFVHEFWTFKRAGSAWSPVRMAKNMAVLACGFTGRVGVIGLLEWFHAPGFWLGFIYFGAGVGVSFTINYLANKHLVFQDTSLQDKA
ncbi:MAG: GtrA family protein [Pseudomonadota bacterium]